MLACSFELQCVGLLDEKFRFWGSGLRVWSLGSRAIGVGFQDLGFQFQASGLGLGCVDRHTSRPYVPTSFLKGPPSNRVALSGLGFGGAGFKI